MKGERRGEDGDDREFPSGREVVVDVAWPSADSPAVTWKASSPASGG